MITVSRCELASFVWSQKCHKKKTLFSIDRKLMASYLYLCEAYLHFFKFKLKQQESMSYLNKIQSFTKVFITSL